MKLSRSILFKIIASILPFSLCLFPANVYAQEGPDISVTKVADPISGAPSTEVTFSITVTNTGDAELDPVHVVDTLPDGLTYVATGTTPAPDDVSGNVITWNNVGPLAKSGDTGDSTVITLKAHVEQGDTGTLTNSVSTTGNAVSDNSTISVSDNSTTDFTRLAPGISITKIADPVSGAPSTEVTFSITVTNTGDAELDPVQVVDTLPDGLTYVATGTTPAPDDITGNVITWNNVGPLAKSGDTGDSTIITLKAHVEQVDPGTITNNVSATGAPPTGDSVSDNSTADFTVASKDTWTKSQILEHSGVPGKGIDDAPGLQKPFNPNSQAANHAGKKDKDENAELELEQEKNMNININQSQQQEEEQNKNNNKNKNKGN